ncbi:forkhead box protein O3-like [Myxocyprinus asiaticus]|uniref:forkhead box protein O3-like n=1 Tax=Myxocyprinus asiaticus TaxID=70543 RepID=UPI0022225CE0|nr:forkhead box protein O3-like [Myxocyprinus asiaticus]
MMMEEDEAEAHQVDMESRPSSCSWPDSSCELSADLSLDLSICKVESDHVPSSSCMLDAEGFHGFTGAALRKTKSSSRRNAWGNQSYAELITRAIESTPDKRLTLSQIYDWMVRYVPYFKDKGDSNSSAGWKNSIRHNLSLHTRFIRVQNEGTGKSSWWMLNPEGGKLGKAPRRRAISMDNSTKYLKSKRRVSRKRNPGKAKQVAEPPVGFCSSPEHCSPTTMSGTGGPVVREDFHTWKDLHSHASSSASTLSGCLSPILAEVELGEPEEVRLSCSTSPHLYPSPSSAHSPASHCNADLRATITYQQHQPMGHQHPSYHYNSDSKSQGSSCDSAYGQPSVGMLLPHPSMQTFEESTCFSGSMQAYTSSSTLQSLLTRGPQFNVKDKILGKENVVHSMMVAQGNRARSSSSQHGHNNAPAPDSSSKPSHSHNIIQRLSQDHHHAAVHSQPSDGHMQSYIHKSPYLYSPQAQAHLSASTMLPQNLAGMQEILQDTCHLETAPYPLPLLNIYSSPHQHSMPEGPYHQSQGAGEGYQYQQPHQLYPHEWLPADPEMDMFHRSLDCDMESILLHGILDSGGENDCNFDSSLAQGMGMGFGFTGTQQNHNKQSWVPG